jgi:hypothetical protein
MHPNGGIRGDDSTRLSDAHVAGARSRCERRDGCTHLCRHARPGIRAVDEGTQRASAQRQTNYLFKSTSLGKDLSRQGWPPGDNSARPFRATPRGFAALSENRQRIDNTFLNQFAEFRAFRARSVVTDQAGELATISQIVRAMEKATPEERIEAAYEEITAELRWSESSSRDRNFSRS